MGQGRSAPLPPCAFPPRGRRPVSLGRFGRSAGKNRFGRSGDIGRFSLYRNIPRTEEGDRIRPAEHCGQRQGNLRNGKKTEKGRETPKKHLVYPLGENKRHGEDRSRAEIEIRLSDPPQQRKPTGNGRHFEPGGILLRDTRPIDCASTSSRSSGRSPERSPRPSVPG